MLKFSLRPGALRFLQGVVLFFGFSVAAFAGTNQIVISQVYGGGGNSGATLNQDYVELFNAGSTPVTMSGWALQYRSATGTSSFNVVKPLATATILPGHFYLIGASTVGSTGAALPTVDDTAAVNLSGTGGVIALTSTTTLLTGCSAIDPSNTVDFVGYGSTTTCYEGTGPTGTLSSTTGATRTNVCVDADNNAGEFTVGALNPRNSATTATPCSSTPVPLSATVAADPTSQYASGVVTFTAAVVPGTNPASTGITVTADLSPIGGSATQVLYDDKTHGDSVSGDYTYTFATNVGAVSTGAKTINFTIKDQSTTLTPSLSFNVITTPVITAIHTIQTGAPNSTYLGQAVTTTGVITGVLSNGFYIEAKDSAWDADDSTSEGIFVHTGTGNIPTGAVVGAEVQLTGTVTAYPTSLSVPGAEIDAPTGFTVLSTGNTMPTAKVLTTADDSPTGTFSQWARLQGMRVTIPSFTTTSATDGSLTESTSTATSTGNFYGTVTGVARPFREPGLSVQDAVPSGAPSTIQRWDGNPELIFVRSSVLGSAMNVASNQILTNLTGIMDLSNIDTSLNSGASVQLLLQTPRPTIPTLPTYTAVPTRGASEFTVATQNVERFFSTTVGSAKLTDEAYARRLSKLSNAVRNVMKTPDILCVEEMGTLDSLNDLAAQISTDAIANNQTDPHYVAYLYTGSDVINNGLLINPDRVTILNVEQIGKTATYTNSSNTQATMNDRPPLVLHAGIKQDSNSADDYKVTVIVNHLKALTDIATSANTPLKRRAQAEYLAALIKGYQDNGERVISVGDYNSFEFNDGYVDAMGLVEGTPTAASLLTYPQDSSYTPPSPALTDLVTTVSAAQRYSYVFGGSAQSLDHIVVTNDLLNGAHISPIRANADFPLIYTNDGTRPESFSDHDGWVAYFSLPGVAATLTASLTPSSGDFGSVVKNVSSTGQVFTLANSGTASLTINSIAASGDFAESNNCGTSLAASSSCSINVVFTPTALGARTGTLTVTTNSTTTPTLTSSLSGTGIVQPTTVSLSPLTKDFGSVVVGSASTVQAFTVTNSASTAATFAVAMTGNYSQTNTCGTTVPANGSCTISVTFAPTGLFTRSGTLTVTTSGSATALVATLTGTGTAQATLTPTTADFGSVTTGSSSTAQTFTFTNLSSTALTINSVGVTTNFSQTNTCGTSVAANSSCTVSVVFSPTAGGALTGTLAISSSSAVSGALTATLTGTGLLPTDFSLSPPSQSVTMKAGYAANFNFLLQSYSGYTGTINLSCAGAPSGSTCTLSPTTVSLAANGTATFTATLNTTTTVSSNHNEKLGISFAGILGGVLLLTLGRSRKLMRGAGLMALLFALLGTAVGCGDSPNKAGVTTVPGNYTFTITASDGTKSHSSTFNVTIN